VSNMAMLCCFACRSTPTIFISASFAPSLFWLDSKSLLGSSRGRRTYVISHAMFRQQHSSHDSHYNLGQISGVVNMSCFRYLLLAFSLLPAESQNVNPANPVEIQAQKHVSPEEMRARLANVELHKDAKVSR